MGLNSRGAFPKQRVSHHAHACRTCMATCGCQWLRLPQRVACSSEVERDPGAHTERPHDAAADDPSSATHAGSEDRIALPIRHSNSPPQPRATRGTWTRAIGGDILRVRIWLGAWGREIHQRSTAARPERSVTALRLYLTACMSARLRPGRAAGLNRGIAVASAWHYMHERRRRRWHTPATMYVSMYTSWLRPPAVSLSAMPRALQLVTVKPPMTLQMAT